MCDMPLKKYMIWSGRRLAWFPAAFSPICAKRFFSYEAAIFLNCEKATANKIIATYNLEKIQ
ncbi:hypothetical protein [Herbaspirillum lusitanum]|uniref:hypothetical protein n=1 Tax=Herbaspirillum lusitanum TaxID=213312 RepID=UPI0012F4D3E1|nr:hypothetical protein [Herbaspirillum lusitanum]